jgi:hypothetical protein
MARVLTDVDVDEIEIGSEQLGVITWRESWYRAAGYDPGNATKLAYRNDIDYRFACKLLIQCKDQELAMSILL